MTNKNIAIITGATGGIGKSFVKQLINGNINKIVPHKIVTKVRLESIKKYI